MPNRQHLVAVARGGAPADRLIRGARVVNVYSGEILEANVALAGGRIAYVGPRQPDARDVLDAAGLYLAPGWIEPHGHPWLLYNPVSMIEGILPGGTTLVFNDDLFFYLQAGPDGFGRMLDALRGLPLDYRWLVRLVSQSQYPGEAVDFALDKLRAAGEAGCGRYRRTHPLARSHARRCLCARRHRACAGAGQAGGRPHGRRIL
ncbi:MAG TPA: hypothetical protein VMR62_06800 [Bryobacteraceae bacterium]|jgi:adenine deaminase|nr:hypothetical protein [Bryobacteraceae bacterium]